MYAVRKFSNGCKSNRSKISQNPLLMTKRNYYALPNLPNIQNNHLILGGFVLVSGLLCYVFYEHKQHKKLKRELQEEKEKNNDLNKMMSQFLQREKLEQELQEVKDGLIQLAQSRTVYHQAEMERYDEKKRLLESMRDDVLSINTDLSSIKKNLSNSSQSRE